MRLGKRIWSSVALAGVVAASACADESTPNPPGDAGAGNGDAGSGPAPGKGGSSGEQNGEAGSPSAGRGEGGRGGSSGKGGGDSGAPPTAGEAGRGGRGGDGARTGEGGAGAPGTRGPFACKEPRSFDGGYVACASDVPQNFVFREFSQVYYSYLHRPTTGTCPNGLNYDGEPGSQGSAGAAGEGGFGWGDPCTSSADCGRPNACADAAPNYCDDGTANLLCRRGCESDADCGEQQICLCGNLLTLPWVVGTCVPASCKTDADCEQGFKCASTFSDAYVISFSCQTADDECAGRDDCMDEYGGEGGYGSLVGGTECTDGPQHRVCDAVRCAYDWGQEP